MACVATNAGQSSQILRAGLGIFACDAWMVVSNESAKEAGCRGVNRASKQQLQQLKGCLFLFSLSLLDCLQTYMFVVEASADRHWASADSLARNVMSCHVLQVLRAESWHT